MDTCHDHEISYWPDMGCPMCAAQSRIAELEAEVSTLREWDNYFRAAFGYKRDGRSSPECVDDLVKRIDTDTAWNDGIEAAAEVFKWNECDLHPKMRKHVIGLIRALRR